MAGMDSTLGPFLDCLPKVSPMAANFAGLHVADTAIRHRRGFQ